MATTIDTKSVSDNNSLQTVTDVIRSIDDHFPSVLKQCTITINNIHPSTEEFAKSDLQASWQLRLNTESSFSASELLDIEQEIDKISSVNFVNGFIHVELSTED